MPRPRCPATIPAKNTKVMPRDTPLNFSLLQNRPAAQISDKTMMACIKLCSVNSCMNHSMFSYLSVRYLSKKYSKNGRKHTQKNSTKQRLVAPVLVNVYPDIESGVSFDQPFIDFLFEGRDVIDRKIYHYVERNDVLGRIDEHTVDLKDSRH